MLGYRWNGTARTWTRCSARWKPPMPACWWATFQTSVAWRSTGAWIPRRCRQRWTAGTRSSPRRSHGMAPPWWICSRPGRRSPTTPSTCHRTASTPARRATSGCRTSSPRCIWTRRARQRPGEHVLGRKPRPHPSPEVQEGLAATAVVEAHALYKTYVSGRLRVPALRGVNLRIERGEIVAIVGPSGCGKTTLLHCLSGLEDFEAGEVLLEGLRLARLSDGQKADHRARRVGFVFQSYNLLPVLNALENVELPLLLSKQSAGEARRRALRALEVVGLENRLRHRPSELSGGQQQRVAIARALSTEPAVIFADEPTGNLDSDSAEEVMQLIDRLNVDNGQTFVLVTHAREVAAHAGRLIRMRDGEIISDETLGE